jgi:hypothetical protein
MHKPDVYNCMAVSIDLGSIKLTIKDHLADAIRRIIYCHPDPRRAGKRSCLECLCCVICARINKITNADPVLYAHN